jgi:ABC-type amino acid transport system permease subunit
VIGLFALSTWAHHLSAAQRNGGNDAYGAAVLCWAVVFAGCLFCWAAAAVSTVRHLNLTVRLLVLETRLATAVTATMAAMTVASSVWWATVARAAPWFFAGTPPRTPGMVAPVNLVIPVGLMLAATLLASVGARRALRNARAIA